MAVNLEELPLPDALPLIPNGWRYESLGDLVEKRGVSYGIVQPGRETTDGVPIVRVNNIRNGRIDTTDMLKVGADVEAKFRRSRLRGGEVLLTLVGTLGEVAIVPHNLCGWNVARAVGVIPVRKDPGSLWVSICLRSAFIQHCIRMWATTTVQATFNLRDLAKLPIPIPPTDTREAIAAVLGALDDKIELNRRMNATLEAVARALFQSWFVDFDPVRAKLDGRTPVGLDAPTAALFPGHLEDSPIDKKPIGWEVTTLETALSVLETGGRPKGGVGGILSGIPSIGAESIVSIGRFDFDKTKFVPVEFYERMNKGHIESHDVLIYKDGGRPGEYEPHVSMFGDGFPFERCCINEHVYRLRANERLSQEYLYFWLTSDLVFAEMRIKGTGVAIPGLNSTAVRSLPILVPPRPVVDAFTWQAAPLITRLLANAKQSRTLATLRDTLLPKLLSGELSAENAARKEVCK
ncbi:MAG TPA: restriction endonuclease subunit S [Chthoniobacterales bacterium]|nr:restriction endonuclease subunit S [Chthoniobacterales bacterium]